MNGKRIIHGSYTFHHTLDSTNAHFRATVMQAEFARIESDLRYRPGYEETCSVPLFEQLSK